MKTAPRCWSGAALIAATLLVSGCAESLFFYSPSSLSYTTPQAKNLHFDDIHFSSRDGTILHGWFVHGKEPVLGTVIHFHGNTKNISGHLRYVDWLPQSGYNVFLFDYRGYGSSEGTPHPLGLHEDSLAAIKYVRSRTDLDTNRLLVFGQSLGGTCALNAVAASRKEGIRAVVVEGTFASHRTIAEDQLKNYPLPNVLRSAFVRIFVGQGQDAEQAATALGEVPLLLIHGDEDDTVPYRHAARICAAATGQATLWTVGGGRHLDTFVYHPVPYRQRLLDFFAAALNGTSDQPPTVRKCRAPFGSRVDSPQTMTNASYTR